MCLGKTAGDLAKERNKVEVSRRIEQVGGEQGRNIAHVFGCGGAPAVLVATMCLQVEPGSSPGGGWSGEGGGGEGRRESDPGHVSEGVRAILECPVCLDVSGLHQA